MAPWFAAAFALQALLLAGVGVIAGRIALQPARGRAFWIAIALSVIIVLGYPLLAPLTGRSWTTAEVFGVAADPTALLTVAVFALVRGRVRWLVLVVPLLWCAFTALTLRAMNSAESFVVIAATLLALLAARKQIT